MDAHAAPATPRPARQLGLMLALGLFFLAVGVPYALKVKDDGRSAFVRWRPQIRDLTRGVNVYERHNYPNPPIMALVLAPLAALPPTAGSLLWFALKVVLAVLAVHGALRLVESPDRPFPTWARLAAVVLSVRPLVGDLMHGNVNVFIFFLVVAALTASRRRRPTKAGLLLALAIACKVTPALFLPYFAWKRAWRTVAACLVGLVLFLGVVPALFLGARGNAELLGSWGERMVLPYLGGRVTTEHQNQSLAGVLCRLTTPAASFSEYRGTTYVPLAYHNLVSLPPPLAHGLVWACLVAGGLLGAWACRTPPWPRARWRPAAEFSLVLLGMLLFSERSWKHHYVSLILPLAVLLYYLAAERPGPWRRRYLVGTLALASLLMAATMRGLPGLPEHFAKLAEVYGAFLWANLLLVAALVVLLRSRDIVPPGEAYRVLEVRMPVPGQVAAGPAREPDRPAVLRRP